MNKDTAKDYLPLVQALAEGRTIQTLCANGDWKDHERIDTDCPAKWYRIKTEASEISAPEEVWVGFHPSGFISGTSKFPHKDMARYIRADLAGEAKNG